MKLTRQIRTDSPRPDGDNSRFTNDHLILIQPVSSWVYLSIVVAVVATIAILGSTLSYSDRRRAQGYIRPISGVMRVNATADGTIDAIYVRAGDRVKEGTRICLVVNKSTSTGEGTTVPSVILKQNSEYVQETEKQLARNEKLSSIELDDLDTNMAFLKRSLESAQQKLEINGSLLESKKALLEAVKNSGGAVSRLEEERLKQEFLACQETDIDLRQQIQSYQHQLKQLGIRFSQRRIALQDQNAELRKSLTTIEKENTRVAGDNSYYIVAPKDGSIANLVVDVGQSVSKDSQILTLIPANQEFEAELLVPSEAIGSVRLGQVVLLRYEAFPHQLFGIKKGKISRVDNQIILPGEIKFPVTINTPVYRARVQLESQLIEKNGVGYQMKPGMLLEADILLEERSIMSWILQPVEALYR
jgi:membrane fusion protein